MRDIPAERLEDLYEYVHSLNPKVQKKESSRKQILSFAGSFSDLSLKDYKSFLKETKKVRNKLFDREINL